MVNIQNEKITIKKLRVNLQSTTMQLTKPMDDVRNNFIEQCKNGQMDLVQNTLRTHPELVTDDHDPTLWSAIFEGCINNQLELIKWLLDTYEFDFIEDTMEDVFNDAFYEVCLNGHFEMAKWIIYVYPEVDIPDFTLVDTCKNGHLKIAKWLTKKSKFSQKIVLEAFKGAKQNNKTDVLNWLLCMTCANGYWENAKWMLIQHEFTINAMRNAGKCAKNAERKVEFNNMLNQCLATLQVRE